AADRGLDDRDPGAAREERRGALARMMQGPRTMKPDLETRRARMVDGQLAPRGITDPRVLDAFRHVPREAFVPEELAEFAYDDTPLRTADGQTVLKRYVVAL